MGKLTPDLGVNARFSRGTCAESKAAWRFTSRRTPKMGAACSRSWYNFTLGCSVARNTYGGAEQQPGLLRSPLHSLQLIRLKALIIALTCAAALLLSSATFMVPHSFAPRVENMPNNDGVVPYGLILSGNVLYGAAYGVNGNITGDLGRVFVVNTDSTSFTTLHRFAPGSNGAIPHSLVLSENTIHWHPIAPRKQG